MNSSKKKNALYIKSKLIDFIIDLYKDDDIVIGSEVMYGSRKGLVDIIQLYNKKLFAFEIKADNDDFRKLPIQINEYKYIFDYIYIVVTNKYLAKAKYLPYKGIGIIAINEDGSCKIVKKATQQRDNNKIEILSTINAQFLKSYFKLNSKLKSSEVRTLLSNKGITLIKETLYIYYLHNISPRYKLFLSEKEEPTHIDDVAILSLYGRKII